MPLRSEIETIPFDGFVGGLNRDSDPLTLEFNESPDAINVDFGRRGHVEKRSGYTSSATHAEVGQGIYDYKGRGLFITKDGDLADFSSGSISSLSHNIGNPSSEREFTIGRAALSDAIYVTRNKAINPGKWDGTSATATSMTPTAFDGSSNVFPRARHLLTAHNRMFAANVMDDAGVEYPSRLYFSDPLDPETWQATDFFDVAPDDGTEIQKIILFGDQLMIFKDYSVHVLVGTSALDFAQFPVDQEVGTTAPDTVVNIGLRLVFFDPRSGVWMFDGADFFRISDKLRDYMLDGMNKDQVHKAYAHVYKNRYYLSLPWGSDSVPSRTFVWDPTTGAWTEYDYGVQGFMRLDTTPFAVGVRDTTGVMEMYTTAQDNGTNISAYFRTVWFSPASSAALHRLRRLDVNMSALGNFDVTVNLRRNFSKDIYVTKLVNTSTGASAYGSSVYGTATYGTGVDQVAPRLGGWGKRWRAMQLEFKEETAGQMQVNRVVLQVSQHLRQRGSA